MARVLSDILQVTVLVHRLYWTWLQRGLSSQVMCSAVVLLLCLCKYVLVGAIGHPTFLEESHFEKITRTSHPLHPIALPRAHTKLWQGPSSSPALVGFERTLPHAFG